MPRSSDLDNIAPDDAFISKPKTPPAAKPQSEPQSQPVSQETNPQKPKKLKKKKAIKHTDSSTTSQRQKVYEMIGHTKHPFSSFLARPKIFNFEERDDNEEILVVLRQHWFTNVNWVLIAIAMSLLPAFFNLVPILESIPLTYKIIATLFWYLMTFAFAFEKFLSWYFNVYIITDERVIDIDFNNLLNKRFSEAKLAVIQDVTSQVTGLYQTMFNFGTIYIQTSAEVPEIQFERVPNPQTVIKILQQLRTEEEQEALEGRIR